MSLILFNRMFNGVSSFKNFRNVLSVERPYSLNENKETKISATMKNHKVITQVIESHPRQTFANMLRNSQFIELGDFSMTKVTGRIIQIMDDYAYVDFGGKFYSVCKIPIVNAARYRRGCFVTIMLKDFELSARFLGATVDTTLLEANGFIVSLSQQKEKTQQTNKNTNEDILEYAQSSQRNVNRDEVSNVQIKCETELTSNEDNISLK